MQKQMSRRGQIRLISYTIALIIALIASTIGGYTMARTNRTAIEYSYQRALGELTEYLGNMDITLEKGKYASSPNQLEGLSNKLWRDAGFAKVALEQLPIRGDELSNTYRFLSQVGNFCVTLSKRIAEGGTLTEEELASLQQLSGYASELTEKMAEMRNALEAGELELGDVAAAMYEKEAAQMQGEELPDLNSGFLELEQGFEDYPTMIYDGPFSDHIQQQEPKFLKDKAEVSQTDALSSAAEATQEGNLQFSGEIAGNLPRYQFTSDTVVVTITKAGGQLDSYINSRSISQASLSVEQALEKGDEALKRMEMGNFVNRYYSLNNGVLTINYAFEKDGVVYYPDLIKVGIAMDNGDMVLFDATGFIMNHTERELPEAKVSMEDAQTKLSPLLDVQGEGKRVVIPSDSLKEQPCYEFTCLGEDGEHVLVYVHVETGLEEQILILLEDETGVLVM